MSEPFSIAGNAFSVVGLTDVVIRLGIEVAGLYVSYSKASQTVNRLVKDLGGLTDLVLRVKDFATASNQQDTQLENTLRECERELVALKRDVQKATEKAADSWTIKIGKRVTWAASVENRILQSCRDIERHKASLNLILTLMGRQNDTIIRRELGETRGDIANAQTVSETSFRRLQQNNTDISEQNNRTLQGISSEVGALAQLSSTGFGLVRHALQSNTTDLGALNGSVASINNNVTDLGHTLQSALQDNASRMDQNFVRSQLVQTEQHQAWYSRVLSQMTDTIHDTLSHHVATMNLSKNDDGSLVFYGDNLADIARPLFLIEADLTKGIQTLMSSNSRGVAGSEARWVQEEFKRILDQGYQAWKQIPTTNFALSVAQSAESVSGLSNKRKRPEEVVGVSKRFKRSRSMVSSEKYYSNTGLGILLLQVTRNMGDRSFRLDMSFLPNIQFCSLAMHISVFKAYGIHMEPQVSRIIRTCNMIPENSKAIICARENDLVGLKELFDRGEASPNDRDEDGMTLIMYTALFGWIQAFEWLIAQGADTTFHHLSKYHTLDWLWFCWTIHGATADEVVRASKFAINQGCDPDDVIGTSIPHQVIWWASSDEGVCSSMSQLNEMGCDMDRSDDQGSTPLLKACWTARFQTVKFLIRIGANVKAIDNWGDGALHLMQDEGGLQCDSGREALTMALKRGCSPTLSNDDGETPFDRIRDKPTWIAWKEVLNDTGYSLFDDDFAALPVLVSTNEGGETRVPISGLTVEEWRSRSKPWREEYWCESERRWKLQWESEYESLCWKKIEVPVAKYREEHEKWWRLDRSTKTSHEKWRILDCSKKPSHENLLKKINDLKSKYGGYYTNINTVYSDDDESSDTVDCDDEESSDTE